MKRLFNLAYRELGGVPVERPSWEDAPETFPISALPWGAYFDADDADAVTVDGSNRVNQWDSSVPSTYGNVTMVAMGSGGVGDPYRTGATTPAGKAYVDFQGAESLTTTQNSEVALGPHIDGATGGSVPGYVSFAVIRPDTFGTDQTTPFNNPAVWSLSAYWFGLALTEDVGGANKRVEPWSFDQTGSAWIWASQPVSAGSWCVVTQTYSNLKLIARVNGDEATETSATNPTDPSTGAQSLLFGYNAGSGFYDGGLALLAMAPTQGWSESRIRDVENYLEAAYVVSASTGTTYEPTLATDAAVITDDGVAGFEHVRAIPAATGGGGTDPATRNCSLYFTDYAGSPWSGTASTGGSGSVTASDANAPSVGSSINSHATADFDGTNDELDVSIAANTALSATRYLIDIVYYVDSLYVGSEFNQPWGRPSLITAAQFWGVSVSSWGVEVFHYDASNAFGKTAAPTLPQIGWNHTQVLWDGTNLYVRNTPAGTATGSWSSPLARGSIDPFLGTLHIGRNNASDLFFDGRIAHIFVDNEVADSTVQDGYGTWGQSRYGLDFGFPAGTGGGAGVDEIEITESVTAALAVTVERVLSDTAAVTDAVTVERDASRAREIDDTVTVSDSTATSAFLTRLLPVVAGGAGVTPSARSLSVLLRDFAGSPWSGSSSTGTSGSQTATNGTNPPSVGSSINSHATADFDGTNDQLAYSATANAVLGSQYLVDIVAYVDTLYVGSEFSHPFQRPNLMTAAAFWGIAVSSWGFEVFHYDSGGTFNKTAAPNLPVAGAWNHFQVQWTGTQLRLRVSVVGGSPGTWSTPLNISSISGSLGALSFGVNNGGNLFFDGRVAHFIVDNGTVDNDVANAYGSFAQTEYGLDFGYASTGSAPGSDAVVVTDSATAALVTDLERLGSDSVSVTDAVTRDVAFERFLADAVTATDTTIAGVDVGRAGSDTISVTDSTTRAFEFGRVATDTASAADATTLNLDVHRTLATDTAAATDAATRAAEFGRAGSDAASVTDSAQNDATLGRSASDAVSTTDAYTWEVGRGLSDTATTTDSTTNSVAYARTLTDANAVTDYLSLEVNESVVDSVATTEALTVVVEYARVASDTASATDQHAWELTRGLSDIATGTDSTVNTVVYARTLEDVVAATDVAVPEVDRALADAASVSDQLTVSTAFARSADDTVLVTDALSREFQVAASDVLSTADTLARALDFSRTPSDTTAFSEQNAWELTRGVQDTATATDATQKNVDYARIAADATTLSDVVFPEVDRAFSDAVSLADQTSNDVEYARVGVDSTSVEDESAATLDALRSQSDSASVTDAVAATLELGRIAADAVSSTDALSFVGNYHRVLSDTATLTELLAPEAANEAGDSIIIDDAVYPAAAYARLFTDAAATTDSAAITQERSSADTLAVSDTTAISVVYGRSVSDEATADDEYTWEFDRTIGDASTVSDTLSSTVEFSRTLSDAAVVIDQVAPEAGGDLYDVVAISDELTPAVHAARSFTDAAAFSDSLAPELERGLADSVSVTDATTPEIERSGEFYDLALSDALVFSDAHVNEMSFGRQLSDGATIDDSIDGSEERSLTDATDITDAAALSVDYTRVLVDAAGIEDRAAIEQSLGIADVVAVVDEYALARSLSLTLTDAIASTDLLAREVATSRMVSDAVTSTDQSTTSTSFERFGSDTVASTEQLAAAAAFGRVLGDAAVGTDLVTVEQTSGLADVLVLTESIQVSTSYSRTVADAVSTTDTANTESDQVLRDDVAIADALLTDKTIGVTRGDTLSVADAAALAADTSRTFTDVIAAADRAALDVSLGLSDAASTTDTGTAGVVFGRTGSDTAAATDDVSFAASYARSLSDAAAIADNFSRAINYHRALNDSATATDVAGRTFDFEVSDSVGVLDAVASASEFGRALTDAVTTQDRRSLEFDRTFRDVAGSTDVAIVGTAYARFGEDVVEEADSASATMELLVRGQDVAVFSDAVSTEAAFSRSAVDVAAVVDDMVQNREFLLVFLDSMTCDDDAQTGYIRGVDEEDSVATAEAFFYEGDFERRPEDAVTTDDEVLTVSDIVNYLDDSAIITERTIVEVVEETERFEGTVGVYDLFMPVGSTGIVFVANVPGTKTVVGARFQSRIRRACMLRAASTLAHWGVREGAIIAFMREAAYMSRQALAAMLGVSEGIVEAWETDQLEMPRLTFDTLAQHVCQLDQRAYAKDLVLHPHDARTRAYRIVPQIPQTRAAYIVR